MRRRDRYRPEPTGASPVFSPRLETGLSTRLSFGDQLRDALATIGAAPMRAVTTTLAVVVGAMAAVTTLSVGAAARSQVTAAFDVTAARRVEATITDRENTGRRQVRDDVDEALAGLAGVDAGGVVRLYDDVEVSRAEGGRPTAVALAGASPGGLAALEPSIRGRALTRFDEGRRERVAIVGAAALERLQVSGPETMPVVVVDGATFAVVGVLDDVSRSAAILDAVVVPASTAAELARDAPQAETVYVTARAGSAEVVAEQLPYALLPEEVGAVRVMHGDDARQLRARISKETEAFAWAVVGLSLLVGFVTIMNVTNATIVERRGEIGLRRALGATREHIVRVVVTETALLGLLGGTTGTVLGALATLVLTLLNRWHPVIDPVLLAAGAPIGLVCGLAAGALPAWKASLVEPAEAVRQGT